ncbi:MAG: L-histidine N(alpha)-methyltransferase, partial [Deltaproteobacteria bacterium]|nr:L-histidine N(alpha)-methyltransferase [Deltaproteobacteria bacterium]
FNLNLLKRLNRECQSNFDLDKFEHLAFYNKEKGRMEMHLKSLEPQEVLVGEKEISFQKNETIHTENSYKYSVEDFKSLAQKAGWNFKKLWTDEKSYFSLQYYQN